MGYLIKKSDKTQEIIYLDYDLNGYIFKPKNKSESSLTVNEVMVINPSMIDKILTIKFNTLFKKISMEAFKVIYDDDSSEGDAMLVLDEIKRFKRIVENKYQKFLSDEKEDMFNKKLKSLENEIKAKMMLIREYQLNKEETHGRSR